MNEIAARELCNAKCLDLLCSPLGAQLACAGQGVSPLVIGAAWQRVICTSMRDILLAAIECMEDSKGTQRHADPFSESVQPYA